jgi:hypothetical protein
MTDIKKQSAYEAYKKFIDVLVSDARTSGTVMRIEEGMPIIPPDDNADAVVYRQFVESLTDLQRQLLINLIRGERIKAYHDLLAQLTYHIDCDGFGMTFNGQPMPVGIEGGLHQDFVGRLSDWEFPEKPDYT